MTAPERFADGLRSVDLEVLRHRLEAIAEEAGETIKRTAISPIVTDGNDYSATLLDPDGLLVAGGGHVHNHWYTCSHAVRATIDRYDDIGEGDVFIANDPHTGGGLHPGDVVIQRPVFAHGERIAWAAQSCHIMDVGGMVPGSFAPAATECFQEALRLPPVRLLRRGIEVREVWDIFRNNVRQAHRGEMDLRSLVAGGNVAAGRLIELSEQVGVDQLLGGLAALIEATAVEFRSRINDIEDGCYRAVNWVEWKGELYRLPCVLAVEGDSLRFDFAGAHAQVPVFFNSKPYIIKGGLIQAMVPVLAWDLPVNAGIFDAVDVSCPPGTIVNANFPAPIGAAHVHAAWLAYDTGMECLRLALQASARSAAREQLTARWAGVTGGMNSWPYTDSEGHRDVMTRAESSVVGASAGIARDGIDFAQSLHDQRSYGAADIEVSELRYPVLIEARSRRDGVGGPGRFRAGAALQVTFRPYGVDRLVGMTWGTRSILPVLGAAGGLPGDQLRYRLHRADGSVVEVAAQAEGVVLRADDSMEISSAVGGGWGDPLDRDPEAVRLDIEERRYSREEARETFGVVIAENAVDVEGTEQLRKDLRLARLECAEPPEMPVPAEHAPLCEEDRTEFITAVVVQRGEVAFAAGTGAALAIAPAHWTDGCPVLVSVSSTESGTEVVTRMYLDPGSGRSLAVEVVPVGEPRSFESLPRRWVEAASRRSFWDDHERRAAAE